MTAETPKKSSFKLDAAMTFLAQAAVAICTFFQYKLVRSHWLDVSDFGAYSQVFRWRNVVEWIVLLVMPTALARQIAAFRAVNNDRDVRMYMWTGLVAGLAFTGLFALVTSLFPASSARILFGNENMAPWMMPFNVLLFGYAFALQVNALCRGFQQFRLSNILLLSYTGVIPLICVATKGHPLRDVVIWNGIASGVAALLTLFALLARQFESAKPILANPKEHGEVLRWLASFGAPRLITQGCTMVLGLCIPWYATYVGNEGLKASVNAVYLVLGASTILVAGMSFVLLPHLSAMLAKGEQAAAASQLSSVIEFALFAGCSASLLGIGFMEPFLDVWVGSKVASYSLLLAMGSLIVPDILLLEILRGPIDAAHKSPWNALTYGIGAVTAVVGIGISHALALRLEFSLGCVMFASYGVSAAAAFLIAKRLYPLKMASGRIGLSLIAFFSFVAGLFLLKFYDPSHMHLAAASVAASAAFVGIAIASKPSWLKSLTSGLARKRPGGVAA